MRDREEILEWGEAGCWDSKMWDFVRPGTMISVRCVMGTLLVDTYSLPGQTQRGDHAGSDASKHVPI